MFPGKARVVVGVGDDAFTLEILRIGSHRVTRQGAAIWKGTIGGHGRQNHLKQGIPQRFWIFGTLGSRVALDGPALGFCRGSGGGGGGGGAMGHVWRGHRD